MCCTVGEFIGEFGVAFLGLRLLTRSSLACVEAYKDLDIEYGMPYHDLSNAYNAVDTSGERLLGADNCACCRHRPATAGADSAQYVRAFGGMCSISLSMGWSCTGLYEIFTFACAYARTAPASRPCNDPSGHW